MMSATEMKHYVQAFYEDGVTLIRKEIELAGAEMSEKISQAQTGIISLIGGMLVGFVGLIFIGHAAAQFLAEYMDEALATLLVAGFFVLVSVIMLMNARSNLRAEELKPRRTIRAAQNVAADLKGDRK